MATSFRGWGGAWGDSWGTTTVVPSTGRLKYWTGSAWVLKPLKVWNGVSWVEKPLKVFNGSSWI